MINFNQTSLKETWNKNVKSIKFDSFDVKATVTKKVAKKRYVIIEFVSCDFDEGKSQIFQNGSYPKTFRSSRPEVFCKKGIHRNFTKFTGKQLCQSLFFNKVAGLGHQHLWWLLLGFTSNTSELNEPKTGGKRFVWCNFSDLTRLKLSKFSRT